MPQTGAVPWAALSSSVYVHHILLPLLIVHPKQVLLGLVIVDLIGTKSVLVKRERKIKGKTYIS